MTIAAVAKRLHSAGVAEARVCGCRCFASVSLSMQTYDRLVRYGPGTTTSNGGSAIQQANSDPQRPEPSSHSRGSGAAPVQAGFGALGTRDSSSSADEGRARWPGRAEDRGRKRRRFSSRPPGELAHNRGDDSREASLGRCPESRRDETLKKSHNHRNDRGQGRHEHVHSRSSHEVERTNRPSRLSRSFERDRRRTGGGEAGTSLQRLQSNLGGVEKEVQHWSTQNVMPVNAVQAAEEGLQGSSGEDELADLRARALAVLQHKRQSIGDGQG
jgi:hypothetical protein